MRVISLNIFGENGDWAARGPVLADGFAQLDPDLIALQETIVRRDGDRPRDQVRELLGERYHVVHQTRREQNGSGVSIVSRWPITDVQELDLQQGPRTADFACTTLMARVAAPTGPVLFVNHFPSWKLNMEAERERQAVIAARAIEATCPDLDDPVIVAGDLDADPHSTSIRFWTGRHSLDGVSVCYRDAWDRVHPGEPGHTYTPDNPIMLDADWPFRRIDYVLVRCAEHGGPALRIDDCRIVFGPAEGRAQASDHYGVLADLAHAAAG